MLRLLVTVIFMAFLSGSAWGAGGGFGGFTVAAMEFNLSSTNDALEKSNFPQLNERTIGTGGMGFALINRLLIGGEGFGGTVSSENESLKISHSIGGGFFNLGYVIPVKSIINIYPIFGIGGVGHSISFRPRLGDISFANLLANPKRTSKMTTGSLSFSFSLGVHLVELFGSISLASILIRGGYVLEVSKPDWSLDDGSKVFAGPKDNLSYPFITLTILFGGQSRD